MTAFSDQRIRSSLALIVGIVLFGLSIRASMSLTALFGALVLGFALNRSRSQPNAQTLERPLTVILLFAVLAFSLATALGLSPRGIGPTSPALESLPAVVWSVLALYVYVSHEVASDWYRWSVVAMTLIFASVLGFIHIVATHGVGIDVLLLHEEAAAAIQQGVNPYTDIVTVPNGAPTAAPGDVIIGYVYPPVTALFYSIGEWTLSDPRYTSLAAWLVFLFVVGLLAVKREGKAPLLVLLLMASMPGWPLVLRAAWTEPLSLALAAVAFLYWKRAAVSGAFVGLTLSSKQYFVVAALLLVLYRGSNWSRRAIWSVLVIVGTVGSAIVWDFSAFWSSAVEFHMSTPSRSDSLNLVGLFATVGLDVELPSFLPIAVGLVASTVTSIGARTRADFFLSLAFTLAASFVFSSQAFPNYWFLIAGLCGLVLLDTISSPERDLQRTSEPHDQERTT